MRNITPFIDPDRPKAMGTFYKLETIRFLSIGLVLKNVNIRMNDSKVEKKIARLAKRLLYSVVLLK